MPADPRPLRAEDVRPGVEVVCIQSFGSYPPLRRGQTYTLDGLRPGFDGRQVLVRGLQPDRNFYCTGRFSLPHTPPTTRALLEAHDPALLKALVEWHDNPERYDAYLRLCLLIRGALIPPPAPQVTDARGTLADGWWQ